MYVPLQYVLVFTILTAANGFATFISGFVPDALTGNGMGTALLVRSHQCVCCSHVPSYPICCPWALNGSVSTGRI
jgi:hypothetical protein